MNEQIRKISIQLKRDLQVLYGERLKGLMLFGSYARGEASLESDVDFLLILNGVFDAWEEIERTGGVVSELSLRYGITISLIPINDNEFQDGKTPFMMEVKKEGIPI